MISRFLAPALLVGFMLACTDMTATEAQRPVHSRAAVYTSGPLAVPVTSPDGFSGTFTFTKFTATSEQNQLLADGSYSGTLNGQPVSGSFTDLMVSLIEIRNCRDFYFFPGAVTTDSGTLYQLKGTVQFKDRSVNTLYCDLVAAMNAVPRDQATIDALVAQINVVLGG